MCIKYCVGAYIISCVQRSEDNFVELVLSSHISMGSGDQTQVSKLAQQVPLPTEPPYTPQEEYNVIKQTCIPKSCYTLTWVLEVPLNFNI